MTTNVVILYGIVRGNILGLSTKYTGLMIATSPSFRLLGRSEREGIEDPKKETTYQVPQTLHAFIQSTTC